MEQILGDLEMQLTLNLDRKYWEKHHRLTPDDIQMAREIILELFDQYHGTYAIPLITTLEYASFVATRTVLENGALYHEPFAIEHMIDDVIRSVRRVFDDFWDELTERTHRLNVCARRIQRTWKEAVSNPSFQVCKNRLLREFEDVPTGCRSRVVGS